jgi:translation initiation factor 5B
MAPKKKSNKKGADDWEADLGESIAPPAAGTDAAAENGDANGDDDAGAGGLMAIMRKNKEKRKKKGITEDFVEGEDPPTAEPAPLPDLSVKAPEEATMDEEFALPEKKGKAGNKNKQAQKQPDKAPGGGVDDDEDGADGGRVLTKAEKEKLKKEREKQRKKENVRSIPDTTRPLRRVSLADVSATLGREEEDDRPCCPCRPRQDCGARSGPWKGQGRTRACCGCSACPG